MPDDTQIPLEQAPSEQDNGDDLKAQLEKARADLARFQTEAEQQKHVNQRQQKMFDEQRRQIEQLSQNAPQDAEDPVLARLRQIEERQLFTEQDTALQTFKLRHGMSDEEYDKSVGQWLSDPANAQQAATFRQDGSANWSASLQNAYDKIQLAEFRAKQAQAAQVAAEGKAKQEQVNKTAVISGDAASAAPETVDLDNMSSDDIYDAGLLEMDDNDPIRPSQRLGPPPKKR
jgi:hypothetical protein